jgi:2-dehydropantoate 2-reductase
MTKILIFGAGGVGCIYALILWRAGEEVTAVCRSNYGQVQQNGITVRSKKWGTCSARPNVVRTPEEAVQFGPFDYILVCSKAFPSTAKLISAAVSPETTIVLAQNGIGIEAEYAVAYPNNTLVSGVVYLPTTQVEPGVIEHGTPLERFEVGTYPANAGVEAKAKVDQLAELFAKGDGTCIPYDDVQSQRWYKLALNAALNPVTALTLCDDANFIRSSGGALEMLKDIMREVGATAQAYGYDNIDETSIAEQMVRHEERLITGGKEPSMLVDVRHERAVEVEAILGNVVRMAKAKKVEVPLLSMLHVLTKARNFSICKPNEWKMIARVD